MFRCSALTIAICVSMTTASLADTIIVNDNFESYLNTAALQASWVSTIASTTSAFLATQTSAGPYPLSPLPGALMGQSAVFDGAVGIGSGSVNKWATPFGVSVVPSATQNVELSVDLAWDGALPNKKLSLGLRYTNGATTENIIELGFWNAFTPNLPFAHRAILLPGGDDWQPYSLDDSLNELGEINSKAGVLAGSPGTPQEAHFHRFKAIISQSSITFTLDLFNDGMNNSTNTPGVDAMDIDADAVVSANGFNDLRFGIPSASGSSTNPFLGVDNVSLRLVDIIGPTEDADFDIDGDVDGKDFLIWQRHSGLMGGATLTQGDANKDLNVDGIDLGIWQNQYGTSPLSANVGALPEPASAVLLLLALAGLAGRNSRPVQCHG